MAAAPERARRGGGTRGATGQLATRVVDWAALQELAWTVRDRAHVIGPTRVGAVVLARDGRTFAGCNVEHRFRSHDVHAEVNAITTMVAGGTTELRAILVVAERSRFTPCGACMDWIVQFGGPRCQVAFQAGRGKRVKVYTAKELMPFYPY